ncbi:hypothetical protein THOM_1854, partial [Trachipleistophora hominis]
VITNGCALLAEKFEELEENFGSDIACEMEKLLLTLKSEIHETINDGNEALKLEFLHVFEEATKSIIEYINKVSRWEYAETDKILSYKCSELTTNIECLIKDVSNKIKKTVYTFNQAEEEDIEAIIRKENQKICTQIEQILCDTHNFDPIIPQLVFPDPAHIASIVSSDKPKLLEEIKKLMNQFIEEAKLEISQIEELELHDQKKIMDKGVAMVMNALEEIVYETLDLIEKKVCSATNKESRTLVESIYRNYSLLEEFITIKASEMTKNTEEIICEITRLEIKAMEVEIADYNDKIAGHFKGKLSCFNYNMP